MLNKLLTMM
jgi:FKBP-type peptidyl-prolyl cis-trans isomerase (trigger factor)